MSVFLRIIGGLVIVLGVTVLVFIAVALLEGDQMRRRWFVRGNVFETACLAGVAMTLGGMLWAITRLAYRQSPVAPPETRAVGDSRPPRAGPRGTGSLLRVMAMLQIGIGFIACVAFYYMMLTPPVREDRWGLVGWLLIVAVASWGYSCLGGILLALTRIAYPPTPRPETPDRGEAPRGPASA